MSRRLFLHSGSFTSASLIFTKIIWQKDKPATYRHTTKLNGNNSRLYYALSVLHTTVRELEQAKSSEKKLALSVEYKTDNESRKNPASSVLTYEIISSEIIRTEKILAEEVNVYQVKAKLVSFSGELQMHTGLGEDLDFMIKPGLSATIAGEQDIYLPFHGDSEQGSDFN